MSPATSSSLHAPLAITSTAPAKLALLETSEMLRVLFARPVTVESLVALTALPMMMPQLPSPAPAVLLGFISSITNASLAISSLLAALFAMT